MGTSARTPRGSVGDDAGWEPPGRREVLLARVLAHEVRAPLVTISHACAALSSGVSRDAQAYVQMIERNVRAITRTVEDLLTLTRDGAWSVPVRPQDAEFDDVVAAAVADARPAAREAGLDLRLRRGGVGAVRVDPDRLRQLVSGLVDNAVKYTPAGGRVVVRTAPVGAGGVRLEVTDTGPGVPEEDWELVFDPFYRASGARDTPGSGIGLAVVRAIVLAHGGSVRLEHGVAGGAWVVVDLPRTPPGPAD